MSTQTDFSSSNTSSNNTKASVVCTTRDVRVEVNTETYFSIEQICDKKTLVQFYTGFVDFETFKIVLCF